MVGLDVLTTLVVAAKTLYEISQEAKESHEECEAIHSTVAALATTLGESLSAVENATVSMQNRLAEITKTIQEITRSMNILISKPFLYKVIHRRSVKSKLKKARTSLYDATNVFQVGAQAEVLVAVQQVRIQMQNIEDARRRDEEKIATEYASLMTDSEDNIIQNLGVEDKKLPEAMLALSKHTKYLSDGLEKQYCERGLDALRRRTGDLRILIDKFAISSYEVTIHYEKKLGTGGFAKVYRGMYNDKAVAVKVLTEGTPWAVIEQEVKVWKDLSHPNILQFVGACPIAEPPFMVSELKQNGDVLEYLRKEPQASRHKILHEASLGLAYLHDLSIVHGDLKATNILIDENGTACLADFGLSRIKLQTTTIISPSMQPQKGTARWMAPEQLRGSLASRSSDIYSFAMTIYETFTGRPPFPDTPDSMLYALVCERAIRPRLDEIRQEVRDLGLDHMMWEIIENCWRQVPKERWTASRLCEGIRSLLNSKPGRTTGNLVPPQLTHSLSAGAEFAMPSQPREFLQPHPPRPHMQPSFPSAPSAVPQYSNSSWKYENAEFASPTITMSVPSDAPPAYYTVSPPPEPEVTALDSISVPFDGPSLVPDHPFSTTSTPDRTPLLIPLEPSVPSGPAPWITSHYPPSNGPPTTVESQRIMAPGLGPYPSKSLPATFSNLADAAHDLYSIPRPLSPGSIDLFTPPRSLNSALDKPHGGRPVHNDTPPRQTTHPVSAPAASSDRSSKRPVDTSSSTPNASLADAGDNTRDYFSPRRISPERRPRSTEKLIDLPNEPSKAKSLSLPDDDIVLPYPGREEKLHPDLGDITWGPSAPSNTNPFASMAYQGFTHSLLTPLDVEISHLSEKANHSTSEGSVSHAVGQEDFFFSQKSPPLETPSLDSSTPRTWEASPTPSSPETLSPELDGPEDLPELDSKKPLDATAVTQNSTGSQPQYVMQSQQAYVSNSSNDGFSSLRR